MAKINLRAWREELAAERQKQFVVNLVAAAFLAAVVVFLIGFYIDMQTDRQKARNNFLRQEIGQLDKQLADIKALKTQRTRLIDRLNAIQELQGTRPLIVRSFDEMVKVLPDGVYYQSLKRSGDTISLAGLAEKSDDVSNLMRHIYASIWFGEPNLSTVANADGMKKFNLSVPVLKPSLEEVN
ncbi:PilN domain-containing protein [Amphritea sp. 2_MG-2023]|jgi:type IV pilus assembly protein PilN|uniref:PilN domain-containing protein n=1 Tax=Amphritea TaxID=515417 RepID=UPI001C06ED15|nr:MULTISPECIES: PilN domain-containing protein [Amphritea]MBU2965720.1 PilN domain-containing protein [Amphritea atlantica]MDO6417276.1 PilN domain-containing protein [Amphritea sp. 2_MG-2023]MDX2423885.1 PilN domain-containing protein [Amphritea sp.]